MRLFISINFDDKTRENILAVQSRLKNKGRGRFTSPANLHLTLAFLGEVEKERMDELCRILDSLTVPEMKLRFSHVGCFRRDSELWWIGLEQNEALSLLQKELIEKLVAAGFAPDRKAFKPHITLARDMHAGRLENDELRPTPFATTVNAVSLMWSHMVDGRLTYDEIYRR